VSIHDGDMAALPARAVRAAPAGPAPPRRALAAASDPADPAADPRLAPVLDALERRAISALSLDFFGTLWQRAVPHPTAVFAHAAALMSRAGVLPRGTDPRLYLHLRARAEARARRGAPGGEVPLAAIHEALPRTLLGSHPARRAAAASLERAAEAELGAVDPAVAALARRARERGVKVAITSDTYLSPDDLLALLAGGGAGFTPDLVVTSSAAGRNKVGGLHLTVAAALGLAPSRLAHLGDDLDADVIAARRAGLAAFHLAARDEELRVAAAREDALLDDPGAPDAGLSWLRGRAAARAAGGSALPEHARLGAAFLGPVLAGFADFVADALLEGGHPGAVFLLREGPFLAELVGAALDARGAALRLSPLWISRQAAFRAALAELSEASLRAALERRERPTVAEFLRALGAPPGAPALPPDLLGERMEREAVVGRVLDALLAPPVRARLEAGAARQRALLAAHLARAAPWRGPVALVDLGWGATIQGLVARALRAHGAPRPLLGLYLAATPRAAEAALEGGEVRGFLASPGRHDAAAEVVARSPELLEQACLHPVGSTLSWTRGPGGAPEPVLAARAPDPAGDAEREAVREGVRRFQAEHLALARRRFGPIPAARARAILLRLLVRPSAAEAALLGGWRHDDNFGSAGCAPIARAAPDLAGRAPAALWADRGLYWPGGAAALSHGPTADAFAAHALLGLFGPDAPPAAAPAAPLRHQIADAAAALARAVAPGLAERARRLALRRLALREPVVPPLRHRAADAANAAVKRLTPGAHGRARALGDRALAAARRWEARLRGRGLR
jgi:FMN phosphatase YigB (HAD superfamily)